MDADFLIIGGGIAGVSASARLAPHGKVVLVEAEKALAHHASGRSAALYEPRYGLPPVVGLSMASGDYFRAADGVLSPRGLLAAPIRLISLPMRRAIWGWSGFPLPKRRQWCRS